MDCCNYVQPTYPGHFYQQQYFCYDNMNGVYGSYSSPQLSDAFDANTSYSRLPNSYPTDYVYNPKEARIRKAMREQSRDLSRQSVLPSSSSSSSSSSTGNNTSSNISTSACVKNNYLNHPITCASSPSSSGQVSSSSSSSYNNNNTRIGNPWFQIGHQTSMKPTIISHRVMPTHQQRIFDKFSSSTNQCYTGDYSIGTTGQSSSGSGESSSTTNGSVIIGGTGAVGNNNSNSSGGVGIGVGLDSNDYCGIGEFNEGQKWHPYQNGPISYHPRMGSMNKIPGRHGITTTTSHSHNPWSQFCGLPLSSIAAQNSVIRGPRHMLFLQDQQERRCNFPDDISMSYMNNKMDIGHQLPNYSQANYQQDNDKKNEDLLKWENENNDNELRDKNKLLNKEKLNKKNDDNNDCKKIKLPLKSSLPSKQPLPGFHQAFGSTEIGRFSRSEYFANMVGDNGVSKNNCTTNINDSLINEQIDTDDNFNGLIINNNDNDNNNNNNNSNTTEVELNTPKWHSPYVTLPITGEI